MQSKAVRCHLAEARKNGPSSRKTGPLCRVLASADRRALETAFLLIITWREFHRCRQARTLLLFLHCIAHNM